jgi:hypothetical protein
MKNTGVGSILKEKIVISFRRQTERNLNIFSQVQVRLQGFALNNRAIDLPTSASSYAKVSADKKATAGKQMNLFDLYRIFCINANVRAGFGPFKNKKGRTHGSAPPIISLIK